MIELITEKLTNIADAIRSKTGETDPLTLDDMPGAIEGISGGGEDNIEKICNNELVNYSNNSITSIRGPVFQWCTSLESVSLPNCISISSGTFQYCDNIININIPNLKKIPSSAFMRQSQSSTSIPDLSFPECTQIDFNAFQYQRFKNLDIPKCEKMGANLFLYSLLENINAPICTQLTGETFKYAQNLKNIDLPACTKINGSAFYSCVKLEKIKLPSIDWSGWNNSSFSNCCYNCKKLTTFDIGESVAATGKSFSSRFWNECAALETIIIRTTNMVGLSATNCLDGCKSLQHIYVPAALVDEYKVATNWVAHEGKFRALEDYTVDGTITGELDPEKI